MITRVCGRFTLTWPSAPELARLLGVEPSEAFSLLYRPRWNVAPTDPHWVVRLRPGEPSSGAVQHEGEREIAQARWGFAPPPSRGGARRGPLINARSESWRMPGVKDALSSPSATRGRCVVPVDGFYEWVGDAKAKRPIWFSAPSAEGEAPRLLRFAGLWEADPGGALRFTFFTTAANDVVADVHDRMPVILAPGDVDTWLGADADAAVSLLRPAPIGTLGARAVVPRANSVKNDDPSCLDPWDPTLEVDLRGAIVPGSAPERRQSGSASKNATLPLFAGAGVAEPAAPARNGSVHAAPRASRKSR